MLRKLFNYILFGALLVYAGNIFADTQKEANNSNQNNKEIINGISNDEREIKVSQDLENELIDLKETVDKMQSIVDEYQKEIQLQIEKKIEERRIAIRHSYDKAIKNLETKERTLRSVAISVYEEFIKKHPKSAYTPDTLFKLSELYYERTNDEYMTANEDFEQKLKEYREGKLKEEPERPSRDLEKIIAIYKRIISQFPDYRYSDVVYYLLAYTLWDQGDEKRSRLSESLMDMGELERMTEPPEFLESEKIFSELVKKYPNSKFIPEAWVRIGEYYFNSEESNDQVQMDHYLSTALEAYTNAANALKDNPNKQLYDKILYKIAWTYYRKNDFNMAAKYFADLLDYYEAQTAKDKNAKTDLRPDAIAFLTILFSNDFWPGAGVEKAKVFIVNRGNPSYARDYFLELGDKLYFDMVGAIINNRSNFLEAVDAYKYAISLDPLNPKNPELQERIIESFTRPDNFDPDTASAERKVFLTQYNKNSEWWKKNQINNTAAIQWVEKTVEKLLAYTASSYHERAQKLREEGKIEEASRMYRAAADVYGEYLALFPHSKNWYELSFFYAECLFFSSRYYEAAIQYEKVRDSRAGKKYFKDAIKSAWIAWAKEIEEQTKNKKLAELNIVMSKDRKDGEKIEPKPLEEQWKILITDYEKYLAKEPKSEEAPKILFHEMQIYYAHDDFDNARKIATELMDKYKKEPAAKTAAELVVESYLTVKDWDKVAEWSEKVQQQGYGDQGFRLEMSKLEAGALFKRAERLFNEGKYEEAAAEYIRLVNKKPENEFADRALMNAAKSYEKLRKFDSAAKIYERIYTEYPQSEFASNSLFLVAQNYEKGFKYEGAIDKYLLLADRYPESEQRASALYNAAMILDNTQNYQKSIEYFQRFIKLFPDHAAVADVTYRIILINEKMKAWKDVIKSCELFIKKYSGDQKQASRVVESYVKIAEAYEKIGNPKLTMKAYEDVLREFHKRNLGPNTRAAYFAGKSKFIQAESLFQKYDLLKIGGSPKTLKRDLEAKAKMSLEVKKAYEAVFPYRQAEWTLASLYRIGNTQQRFAASLYEVPVPKELKEEEEKEMYRVQLEEFAAPIEDKAVELYEVARKKAAEMKVVNQWTKKTLESLNKLRPSQYPLLKEAKGVFIDTPDRTLVLDDFEKEIPKSMPTIEGAENNSVNGKKEDKHEVGIIDTSKSLPGVNEEQSKGSPKDKPVTNEISPEQGKK